MDISKAIQKCRPGAEFSAGEDYASIVWLDQDQVQPTEQELEDAWMSIQIAEPLSNAATPVPKLVLTNIEFSSI